jgi:hypothetical protein
MGIVGLSLASTVLACAACVSTTQPPEANDVGPDMLAIPRPILEKCVDVGVLETVCPSEMPQVIDKGRRSKAFRTEGSSIFFAEWSAPYPGLSRRNAPPRFAHLNVIASPVDDPLGFRWPTRATTGLEDLDNSPKKRSEPLLLGAFTWGGKEGEVALAPSFPAGGIEGDHLIFRWIEADTAYSISLHAWKPAAESLESLRAVVVSLPT